jgi:hypothetical protein
MEAALLASCTFGTSLPKQIFSRTVSENRNGSWLTTRTARLISSRGIPLTSLPSRGEERALPAPRLPYEADDLSFPEGEGDPSERLAPVLFLVGEREIPNFEERGIRTPAKGKQNGLPRFPKDPEKLVDSTHRAPAPLDEVDDPSKRHRREGEHREIGVECDEASQRQTSPDHEPPPQKEDEGHSDPRQQADRPVEGGRGLRDGDVLPVVLPAGVVEPILLLFLQSVCLDQPDTGDVFLKSGVHRGKRLLGLTVVAVERLSVFPGCVHDHGGPSNSQTAETSLVSRDITSPVGVLPKNDMGRRITWERTSRRRRISTLRAVTSIPRRPKYRNPPCRPAKRTIQETARTTRSFPAGAEIPSIASRIIQGTRSPKRLETTRTTAHETYARLWRPM